MNYIENKAKPHSLSLLLELSQIQGPQQKTAILSFIPLPVFSLLISGGRETARGRGRRSTRNSLVASSERCEWHECVREQDRSFSFVAVVGNAASASVMGAGAQEDEEEITTVAEGGVGEEEQAAAEGAGEEEQLEQGAGGEGEGGEEKAPAVMLCSICLDTVVAGGEERSTARLQCGHEFHLGERLRCLEISRLFLDCATHVFGRWRWRRQASS
jgi:hypothetical protein